MTVDRYGHQDDAIERFQALKQKLFVESIKALEPVAQRILKQIDADTPTADKATEK
jgi:hypothetical protein